MSGGGGFFALVTEAVADEGKPLEELDRALIRAGLAASVTSMSEVAFAARAAEAYWLGATPQQLQEVVSVVSGLGVHSLMITATTIIEQGRRSGYAIDAELTADENALWQAKVGDDPFWADMDRELPGFLHALLKLSPAQFKAFFDYCSVPWQNSVVRARTKELLALASDAVPQHPFVLGFKLHLRNAIKLGAGRAALLETLKLAEEASACTAD